MTKHIVQTANPGLLHDEFIATNDGTASPTGMQQVANAFNFWSCKQKKLIMIRAQDHTSSDDGGPIEHFWPHYWRTGENASAVVVRVGIVSRPSGSTATVAYAVRAFSTGDASDTLVGSVTHDQDGVTAAGAINPSQVYRRTFVVRGLSANTEYHGRFTMTNGSRIVYAVAHEEWAATADDAVTGVCSPDKFHAEGPIYDEHAQDFSDANNKLWRHNGAPYIGWAGDYSSDGAGNNCPTTTSASFADLIANSAGFYVASQYHGTRRRPSAIPVKMGVKTYQAGGSCDAEFRLTDGTNNIDITGVTVPTAANARWFTTTATISDTPATWRMQARRTAGAGTVTVCGWSLFPFET